MATPRVAAGVLYRDSAGRVLLVKPIYKDGWDLPGGYVEPGESPHAAASREVQEELGAALPVGRALVVDWAPHPEEGDKLLFIFDGGAVDDDALRATRPEPREIEAARFHPVDDLFGLAPARLARRIALAASVDQCTYAEHGSPVAEFTG
jgi:8-oxo-dGTP diphosphatase